MTRGKDYIGVGVGAVLFDKKGRVFLALRGPKSKNERGKWEFPGGGMEFGQTMEETVIREMYEEFGIRIKAVSQLWAVDHILPHEKQHWIAIGYICKIIKGDPVIREVEKCSVIGWFTLDEAQKMPLTTASAVHLKVLQTLLRRSNTIVRK